MPQWSVRACSQQRHADAMAIIPPLLFGGGVDAGQRAAWENPAAKPRNARSAELNQHATSR
jgi:hypothetical protein